MLKCKKHDIALVVKYKSDGKKGRCKLCSQEKITEQRRRNKIKLVLHFGGKCIKCGYSKCVNSLTFHHRNPEEKEFGIGSGSIKSIAKLIVEASKCDLLCHNCHGEEHARPEDFVIRAVVP